MDLLEVFQDSADVVDFPSGTVIFSEDTEGKHMYVVVKGQIEVSLHDKVIATLQPGEMVGEMALINSDTRCATATTLTDCQLAIIDRSSFESLLRHVPEFASHVMKVLADRLQTAYGIIEG
jgi:CRP-like cAMP-binding protein